MEVPYEREDEEVMGVQNLQTRHRSAQTHHSIPAPTIIDSFSITSMDANNDHDVKTTTVSFTNGEKPQIIQEQGVNSESNVPNKIENVINAAHNGESNGFTKVQNGDGVVEYPTLPESNGGDGDTKFGALTSSFSKSPKTAVGLKNVESLFHGSSNGVNGTSSDVHNAENLVNKTLILSGQDGIVEASGSQEVELVPDEYNVERVIHNQKSHYLICPHCNHDVTERIILKRRKRIRDPTLEGAADKRAKQETKDEKESSQGCIDAISCFSCFSIFVPKGDGFLWWRFTPKPAVPSQTQTDDSSALRVDPAKPFDDDQSGKSFPFWILTCCQPYHTEKSVLKPVPKPPLTSGDGKETQPIGSKDTQHNSDIQPSKGPDTHPELPPSKEPVEGQDSPLWFLSCCQPSENIAKPKPAPKPDKPGDPTSESSASLKPDTPTNAEGLTSIKLGEGTSPKPGEGTTSPADVQPLVTHTEDKEPSLWFFTCCEPGSEGEKQKHPEKPGLSSPSLQSETPPPSQPPSKDEPLTSTEAFATPGHAFPFWFVTCCQPSTDGHKPKPTTYQGTQIQRDDGKPPSAHPDGMGIQPNDSTPPLAEPSGQPIQYKPRTPIKPSLDIPSPPMAPLTPPKDIPSPPPEAPPTPPTGGSVPDKPPVSQPSSTPSDTYNPGIIGDIEQPLIQHPHEIARARGSGVDIIKAIVYGGLLECITSLSVITSAAGGDATTLNIVALGLANVFAGLVLLLHNLRVLNHEQTTEHYEEQLGRPGHYLLHAFVAILSYLIFGLMSPLIYGFTFRKSDNKDYKLLTIASASLLSIAILSIAKAYVRRPPKAYFQTFFYYVSMAFAVSGVGYVAGDLINELLKKLGVFDSREAPAGLSKAWATY